MANHNSIEIIDAFISHASEDIEEVAKPLALELTKLGLNVWFAEFSLHLGDSLSASIDYGLSKCDYGIVILSKKFFEKGWTMQELSALLTKQVNSNRRIVFPIWHNISKEEIPIHSAILADSVAARTNEGISNIARKLYNEIRGIGVADLSSDTELKDDLSTLFKSIEERESLIKETEDQILIIVLTKLYLITKGYRIVFVYFHPFSQLLCSNHLEIERLKKFIEILMSQNLITSKALSTISITHQGIKKIENLLERSSKNDSNNFGFDITTSINEEQKKAVFEIQKLRHVVLKRVYDMSNEKIKIVNLFEIGEPLGIEKEKLKMIYYYLEDEAFIGFYALGGCFFITDKGKEFIEKNKSNRIF